jgi:hypothetical protein
MTNDRVKIPYLGQFLFLEKSIMRLDAPRTSVWWIAVVIGILGIIGNFITLPFISGFAFWFVVIGFVLLAISTC